MKLSVFWKPFLIIFTLKSVVASNILGLFLTHSRSHLIVHLSLIRALVDQGHNVTVITSMPLKEKDFGFRHIFLRKMDLTEGFLESLVNGMKIPFIPSLVKWFFVLKKMTDYYSDFTKDPDYIRFVQENNTFDLMIFGYMYNNYQLGVAAHFKCPTIILFVLEPFGGFSRIMGNPTHPEFIPFSPFMKADPMDFLGRVLSLFYNFIEWLYVRGMHLHWEKIYNKNFPIDKYPTYSEVIQNVSLGFCNHHFSEGPIKPLIPGIIEVGGIHIKEKPDPLPKDIDHFLNMSSQGAIFFSLGTNVQINQIGGNASDMIYNVFSSLPYNIIWKYDNNSIPPGRSPNIFYKSWVPQEDILSHKNLKLFITHAGKGGLTESLYHGVPMVAIPVMMDQDTNAEKIQRRGFGIALGYETMTETSFRKAIMEVMKNQKYKRAVDRFSEIYRDRPLTPRENVVYWTEYVIRHKGAPHMQSPLKTMNVFQALNIDVVIVLVIMISISYLILKKLIFLLYVCFKIIFRKRKYFKLE